LAPRQPLNHSVEDDYVAVAVDVDVTVAGFFEADDEKGEVKYRSTDCQWIQSFFVVNNCSNTTGAKKEEFDPFRIDHSAVCTYFGFVDASMGMGQLERL